MVHRLTRAVPHTPARPPPDAPFNNDRPRKVETMRLCKGKATLSILVTALTLATGFGAASAARAADAHFVLISHAPDLDSWWNTIKNAIKQADEDFSVESDYRNPPNGDIADMARLIEQAAARNYDGVITTVPDFDVLKSSISKVTEKHIPLVTINS